MSISHLVLVYYLMSNFYWIHFGYGNVAGLVVVMINFYYDIVIFVEVGVGLYDFDCYD